MKTKNKFYLLLFISIFFNITYAAEVNDFEHLNKRIVYLASFFPRNVFLSSSQFGRMNSKKQSLKKYLKHTLQYKNLLNLINEFDSSHIDESKENIIDNYWFIGEFINAFIKRYKKSKNFDKYLVNQLSIDTRFDKKTIIFMIDFNKLFFTYSHKISLEHYNKLVLIENPLEREFYYKLAILKHLDFVNFNNILNDKFFEKNSETEKAQILEANINEFTPMRNDKLFLFNESIESFNNTETKII